MIAYLGQAIVFQAAFVASKVGATGLIVTVDVYRNGTEIVTAGDGIEMGDGIYSYTLSAGSVTALGYYNAVFKTSDSAVDQQHLMTRVDVINLHQFGALTQGTAQAGAAGTITLHSGAASSDDLFNDALVVVVSGTGAGQARLISDYVGSTKVASVVPNWTTNPDSTSVFVIVPGGRADIGLWLGSAPNALSSGRVDATVGAMQSGVVTASAVADGAIDAGAIATGTITAAKFASGAIDAAALAADAISEIQSGLALAADLAVVDINVDAIKAQTDQFVFVAGDVKATLDGETVIPADGSITAAVIATNAVDGDAVAASAVTKIQAGLSTLDGAGVQSALTAQGYTSTRAGYLDTLNGLVAAIWDRATSTLTTAGSVGKLIADNVNATISSRLASASYTAAPAAADVADAVWDELLSGHTTTGSAGKKLGDISTSGGGGGATAADIWAYTTRTLTSSGEVIIVAPVNPTTNRLTIVRGDAYLNSLGRRLEWTSSDWTAYGLEVADVITFKVRSTTGDHSFEVAGAMVTTTKAGVELSSTVTAAMYVGTGAYNYDVSTVIDGSTVTLVRGEINVERDVIV